MRTRVEKFAHVLERLGLALTGAASGLFVAALVGSSVAVFTNNGFLLLMIIVGAVGFYLGIDTPRRPVHNDDGTPPDGRWFANIDAPDLLGAVGTFLAALSAFASVAVIVLRLNTHIAWPWLIMVGWAVGVAMQIIAGASARSRQ